MNLDQCRKPIRKIPAAALCVIFTFTSVVRADTAAAIGNNFKAPVTLKYSSTAVTRIDELAQFPQEFGTLKSKFQGTGKAIVIHIQDAHANEDAQRNIAHLLTYFGEKQGLSLVNVEGAAGELDTQAYSFAPSKEVRRDAADYFLSQGRMSGTEYSVIVDQPGFIVNGVEDKDLYDQNRRAYLDALDFKSKDEDTLVQLHKTLDQVSRFEFSSDIRDLNSKRLVFQQSGHDLVAYVRALQMLAAKNKIDLMAYRSLQSLIQLTDLEGRIHFEKADREVDDLVRAVKKALPPDQLSEYLTKTIYFRLKKINRSDFYRYLSGLANHALSSMDKKQHENALLYIRYIQSFEAIDAQLFDDLTAADAAVRAAELKTDSQKQLDRLWRIYDIASKLFDFTLTKDDAEFYFSHHAEFKAQVFERFLALEMDKYHFSYQLPPLNMLDRDLPQLEKFYDFAIKRDGVLIERAINKAVEGHPVSAIVTGGFHTPGIERRLRARGISYLVITPKITTAIDQAKDTKLYEDAMRGTPLKIEKQIDQALAAEKKSSLNDPRFQLAMWMEFLQTIGSPLNAKSHAAELAFFLANGTFRTAARGTQGRALLQKAANFFGAKGWQLFLLDGKGPLVVQSPEGLYLTIRSEIVDETRNSTSNGSPLFSIGKNRYAQSVVRFPESQRRLKRIFPGKDSSSRPAFDVAASGSRPPKTVTLSKPAMQPVPARRSEFRGQTPILPLEVVKTPTQLRLETETAIRAILAGLKDTQEMIAFQEKMAAALEALSAGKDGNFTWAHQEIEMGNLFVDIVNYDQRQKKINAHLSAARETLEILAVTQTTLVNGNRGAFLIGQLLHDGVLTRRDPLQSVQYRALLDRLNVALKELEPLGKFHDEKATQQVLLNYVTSIAMLEQILSDIKSKKMKKMQMSQISQAFGFGPVKNPKKFTQKLEKVLRSMKAEHSALKTEWDQFQAVKAEIEAAHLGLNALTAVRFKSVPAIAKWLSLNGLESSTAVSLDEIIADLVAHLPDAAMQTHLSSMFADRARLANEFVAAQQETQNFSALTTAEKDVFYEFVVNNFGLASPLDLSVKLIHENQAVTGQESPPALNSLTALLAIGYAPAKKTAAESKPAMIGKFEVTPAGQVTLDRHSITLGKEEVAAEEPPVTLLQMINAFHKRIRGFARTHPVLSTLTLFILFVGVFGAATALAKVTAEQSPHVGGHSSNLTFDHPAATASGAAGVFDFHDSTNDIAQKFQLNSTSVLNLQMSVGDLSTAVGSGLLDSATAEQMLALQAYQLSGEVQPATNESNFSKTVAPAPDELSNLQAKAGAAQSLNGAAKKIENLPNSLNFGFQSSDHGKGNPKGQMPPKFGTPVENFQKAHNAAIDAGLITGPKLAETGIVDVNTSQALKAWKLPAAGALAKKASTNLAAAQKSVGVNLPGSTVSGAPKAAFVQPTLVAEKPAVPPLATLPQAETPPASPAVATPAVEDATANTGSYLVPPGSLPRIPTAAEIAAAVQENRNGGSGGPEAGSGPGSGKPPSPQTTAMVTGAATLHAPTAPEITGPKIRTQFKTIKERQLVVADGLTNPDIDPLLITSNPSNASSEPPEVYFLKLNGKRAIFVQLISAKIASGVFSIVYKSTNGEYFVPLDDWKAFAQQSDAASLAAKSGGNSQPANSAAVTELEPSMTQASGKPPTKSGGIVHVTKTVELDRGQPIAVNVQVPVSGSASPAKPAADAETKAPNGLPKNEGAGEPDENGTAALLPPPGFASAQRPTVDQMRAAEDSAPKGGNLRNGNVSSSAGKGARQSVTTPNASSKPRANLLPSKGEVETLKSWPPEQGWPVKFISKADKELWKAFAAELTKQGITGDSNIEKAAEAISMGRFEFVSETPLSKFDLGMINAKNVFWRLFGQAPRAIPVKIPYSIKFTRELARIIYLTHEDHANQPAVQIPTANSSLKNIKQTLSPTNGTATLEVEDKGPNRVVTTVKLKGDQRIVTLEIFNPSSVKGSVDFFAGQRVGFLGSGTPKKVIGGVYVLQPGRNIIQIDIGNLNDTEREKINTLILSNLRTAVPSQDKVQYRYFASAKAGATEKLSGGVATSGEVATENSLIGVSDVVQKLFDLVAQYDPKIIAAWIRTLQAKEAQKAPSHFQVWFEPFLKFFAQQLPPIPAAKPRVKPAVPAKISSSPGKSGVRPQSGQDFGGGQASGTITPKQLAEAEKLIKSSQLFGKDPIDPNYVRFIAGHLVGDNGAFLLLRDSSTGAQIARVPTADFLKEFRDGANFILKFDGARNIRESFGVPKGVTITDVLEKPEYAKLRGFLGSYVLAATNPAQSAAFKTAFSGKSLTVVFHDLNTILPGMAGYLHTSVQEIDLTKPADANLASYFTQLYAYNGGLYGRVLNYLKAKPPGLHKPRKVAPNWTADVVAKLDFFSNVLSHQKDAVKAQAEAAWLELQLLLVKTMTEDVAPYLARARSLGLQVAVIDSQIAAMQGDIKLIGGRKDPWGHSQNAIIEDAIKAAEIARLKLLDDLAKNEHAFRKHLGPAGLNLDLGAEGLANLSPTDLVRILRARGADRGAQLALALGIQEVLLAQAEIPPLAQVSAGMSANLDVSRFIQGLHTGNLAEVRLNLATIASSIQLLHQNALKKEEMKAEVLRLLSAARELENRTAQSVNAVAAINAQIEDQDKIIAVLQKAVEAGIKSVKEGNPNLAGGTFALEGSREQLRLHQLTLLQLQQAREVAMLVLIQYRHLADDMRQAVNQKELQAIFSRILKEYPDLITVLVDLGVDLKHLKLPKALKGKKPADFATPREIVIHSFPELVAAGQITPDKLAAGKKADENRFSPTNWIQFELSGGIPLFVWGSNGKVAENTGLLSLQNGAGWSVVGLGAKATVVIVNWARTDDRMGRQLAGQTAGANHDAGLHEWQRKVVDAVYAIENAEQSLARIRDHVAKKRAELETKTADAKRPGLREADGNLPPAIQNELTRLEMQVALAASQLHAAEGRWVAAQDGLKRVLGVPADVTIIMGEGFKAQSMAQQPELMPYNGTLGVNQGLTEEGKLKLQQLTNASSVAAAAIQKSGEIVGETKKTAALQKLSAAQSSIEKLLAKKTPADARSAQLTTLIWTLLDVVHEIATPEGLPLSQEMNDMLEAVGKITHVPQHQVAIAELNNALSALHLRHAGLYSKFNLAVQGNGTISGMSKATVWAAAYGVSPEPAVYVVASIREFGAKKAQKYLGAVGRWLAGFARVTNGLVLTDPREVEALRAHLEGEANQARARYENTRDQAAIRVDYLIRQRMIYEGLITTLQNHGAKAGAGAENAKDIDSAIEQLIQILLGEDEELTGVAAAELVGSLRSRLQQNEAALLDLGYTVVQARRHVEASVLDAAAAEHRKGTGKKLLAEAIDKNLRVVIQRLKSADTSWQHNLRPDTLLEAAIAAGDGHLATGFRSGGSDSRTNANTSNVIGLGFSATVNLGAFLTPKIRALQAQIANDQTQADIKNAWIEFYDALADYIPAKAQLQDEAALLEVAKRFLGEKFAAANPFDTPDDLRAGKRAVRQSQIRVQQLEENLNNALNRLNQISTKRYGYTAGELSELTAMIQAQLTPANLDFLIGTGQKAAQSGEVAEHDPEIKVLRDLVKAATLESQQNFWTRRARISGQPLADGSGIIGARIPLFGTGFAESGHIHELNEMLKQVALIAGQVEWKSDLLEMLRAANSADERFKKAEERIEELLAPLEELMTNARDRKDAKTRELAQYMNRILRAMQDRSVARVDLIRNIFELKNTLKSAGIRVPEAARVKGAAKNPTAGQVERIAAQMPEVANPAAPAVKSKPGSQAPGNKRRNGGAGGGAKRPEFVPQPPLPVGDPLLEPGVSPKEAVLPPLPAKKGNAVPPAKPGRPNPAADAAEIAALEAATQSAAEQRLKTLLSEKGVPLNEKINTKTDPVFVIYEWLGDLNDAGAQAQVVMIKNLLEKSAAKIIIAGLPGNKTVEGLNELNKKYDKRMLLVEEKIEDAVSTYTNRANAASIVAYDGLEAVLSDKDGVIVNNPIPLLRNYYVVMTRTTVSKGAYHLAAWLSQLRSEMRTTQAVEGSA